jgi:glycosyltransferase involved in cell wall biosynthesis
MKYPRTSIEKSSHTNVDLVCFSHLRWDFVFQRPQHLMTRFAQRQRVFFVEEPQFRPGSAELRVELRSPAISVVTPLLPADEPATNAPILRALLVDFFRDNQIKSPIAWYYSPMFLEWTSNLAASIVVYDCMDELSAFKNAHPRMKTREEELLALADVVFTGGHSLYEAKKAQHSNMYPFPSSIDVAHFAQARRIQQEPADQASIPSPKIGFCGVIDERLDLELLEGVARARPDWNLVLIGPVVKIDHSSLPCLPNIHYLGAKNYTDLPAYLSGWTVAILPFALNESTRFISPTKTPEYLAAGRPVVSTPIEDVVRTYGKSGLAHIAQGTAAFVDAIDRAFSEDTSIRLRKVDESLSQTSWSRTWGRMAEFVDDLVARRRAAISAPVLPVVADLAKAARAGA